MARGYSLLEIGDDLPRIGRHVLRYRHGASLSAREGGDLVARIDAHPSICQQVAPKLRQRPTGVEADLGRSSGFTAMERRLRIGRLCGARNDRKRRVSPV